MAVNVYQMVTDRIIAALESGTIPWEKPWINTSGTNVAVSHQDGRTYSILNQMMLDIPGEWITFKQAEKEGGHIKKGAKSSKVVFFKMMQKEHTDQNGNTIIDAAAQSYLARSGVTLRHYEQGQSYYSPGEDEIILPHMNQFQNAESYYATLFHEMGHSTGHPSRLSRIMGRNFGDSLYSREKLVAEITSAVLCNHFGIDTSKIQRNTAVYIQHWLNAIKEDSRMVVTAATRAEKAVKLILGEQEEMASEKAS